MATDDSFKTIDYRLAKPQSDYSRSQTSKSRPDQTSVRSDLPWCLEQARLIAGCYRRDEAHNPEAFISALALVLSDFPVELIKLAADPRTGVVREFPMGLPNVGQVREFLEHTLDRQASIGRLAAVKSRPRAKEPEPPRAAEHVSYKEFLEMAKRGECSIPPVGRFEREPGVPK